MYLTPTKSHWACDIEADGLLEEATRIWCVCVENIITKEKKRFTDARSFREWLETDYTLVGHNFLAYDAPMLNRHWGCRIAASRIVDTFVLSQLYSPSLKRPKGISKKKSSHSLEAWGIRLKFPKTEHKDFTCLTPEMLEYCTNDTMLTAILYRKLSVRMKQLRFTETGADIEHLSWNIIQNKQRRHGFPFDKRKAEELLVKLEFRREQLQDEIYKLWPPELKCVKQLKRRRLKSGADNAQYLRHKAQYPLLKDRDDGGYDAYDYVAFNLGSPSQRVEKLLELGWTPTQFTKKTDKGGGGNPKVDEESLVNFAELTGRPQIKALATWIVVNSRITNMLRPWLNAYNEETGSIHGKLFLANTLRYRHSDPNTANIPAVRTEKVDGKEVVLMGEPGAWAYECRDLFTCGRSDTHRLVGVDAKGIQIRILLNYAYSKEAFELYTTGDPHVNNAKILGLAHKPAAKKFFYTLIMGGSGKRLAADQAQFGTKLTAAQGKAMKEQMIETIPGFKELIDRLERELNKTGRITLCDGTPIVVSSPHMVIPYLLQGDESRIMKKASIWLDEIIRKEKIPAAKVGDIHDEWQFVVSRDAVPRFMEVALSVFPRVGEFFNYIVPIEGDAKEGLTWAETH